MRLYMFLVIACLGIMLGGKMLLAGLISNKVHDEACGSAMLLFSIASVVLTGWKIKRKSTGNKITKQ